MLSKPGKRRIESPGCQVKNSTDDQQGAKIQIRVSVERRWYSMPAIGRRRGVSHKTLGGFGVVDLELTRPARHDFAPYSARADRLSPVSPAEVGWFRPVA